MQKSFENYYNDVSSKLAKYELIRLALIVLVALIEVGLILVLINFVTSSSFSDMNSSTAAKIILIIVMLAFGAYNFTKKCFEAKIKEMIIERFCECFEDYDWESWHLGGESLIDDKSLKECGILPFFNATYSDDNFLGSYKNLSLKITEQKLKAGTGIYAVEVFEGLVIEYSFPLKTFGTKILVCDKNVFPSKGLEKVVLEDIKFNEMFTVYSDNQIESRFILTTSFMERLKTMKNLFNARHVSASIVNNKLYIAVDIGKDLFNIASLFKSVDNKKDLEKMYNQFDFILRIADLLRLPGMVKN